MGIMYPDLNDSFDANSSVLVTNTSTGGPQLVQFLGPQETALLEKPH